ncbi:serine hydrolase [Ideonella sp. DXS22W]|uniref:Serine hydrolase n=1 Tax=Pseudaquabacterium inlustre TaxID=2984192 RepID=A0ABU9CP69_9BURK
MTPRLIAVRPIAARPIATHHHDGRRARALTAGLLSAAAVGLAGCASGGLGQAPRVASGLTSQLICIDVLHSGLPLADALRQRVAPLGAMGLVMPLIDVQVDAGQGRVHTRLAGGWASQAQWRPGLGCLVDWPGDAPAASAGLPPVAHWPAPELPAIAGPAPVAAANPALAQALARGFDEPDAARPSLFTQAIVVLQHGRVVGEQYAPGLGPATPLLGFSMSKSLTHALAGVLVQQGRLQPDRPGLFPAWQVPGDARAAITLDHLLRQTSGLAMRQDNSGTDPNSRMLFIERDKAGWLQQQPLVAPVGAGWAYSDGHFVLAGRLLRDAAGGSAAALHDLAVKRLFGPLGMHGVTLTVDATDTPNGASMFVAPARDWARLGQLYLNDGLAGGRRVLPEGWVRHATTPTLDTAYGAGWWTNTLGGSMLPQWGVPWGFASAPRDAFFARGFMGQFTLVVPSRGVVIVRMGISHQRGDAIEAVDRLVGEVLAALPE